MDDFVWVIEIPTIWVRQFDPIRDRCPASHASEQVQDSTASFRPNCTNDCISVGRVLTFGGLRVQGFGFRVSGLGSRV